LFSEAGFPYYEVIGFESEHRFWPRKVLFGYKQIIEDLLELYRSLKPELIIVDDAIISVFLSLPAEVLGIPCIAISNRYLLPTVIFVESNISKTVFINSLKLTWLNKVIKKIPEAIFTVISSFVSKLILFFLSRVIINRFRSAYDLKPVNNIDDLLQNLQDVMLLDLELMAPRDNLPEKFNYVGPVAWQPDIQVPEPLQSSHNLIYVSMGSTGNPEIFELLLSAFNQMPEIEAVMAVGDLVEPERLPSLPANVQVYRFLPGGEMAKRAQLVICHGGWGTIYQALAQGVPILGIPNQPFHEGPAIDRLEDLGLGRKLVEAGLTTEMLTQTMREMLANESYYKATRALASQFRLEDGPQRAVTLILSRLKEGCDDQG
jgi:MGT family glycosyltransferase